MIGISRVFAGTITRAAATATGTEAITGVGGKPRLVFFVASDDGATGVDSMGIDNAAISSFIGSNTLGSRSGFTTAIDILNSLGDGHNAKVNSMDADGFTLGWTKVANGRAITVKYYAII